MRAFSQLAGSAAGQGQPWLRKRCFPDACVRPDQDGLESASSSKSAWVWACAAACPPLLLPFSGPAWPALPNAFQHRGQRQGSGAGLERGGAGGRGDTRSGGLGGEGIWDPHLLFLPEGGAACHVPSAESPFKTRFLSSTPLATLRGPLPPTSGSSTTPPSRGPRVLTVAWLGFPVINSQDQGGGSISLVCKDREARQ